MHTVTAYPPGMHSWVDLATTEPEEAKAFYGALLGWTFEDRPAGPDQTYIMCQLDGHDVAALFHGGPHGGPPHWNHYVSVADAAATAERAVALGGRVLLAAHEVMDAGRMAVVAAPDGSAISLWEPHGHFGAALVNQPGTMCWNELNSRDLEAGKRFYSELFGWRLDASDGPMGEYVSIYLGERQCGGMTAIAEAAGDAPSHWLVYFAVADCDQSAARVAEMDGQVVAGPMDIPEVGRMCVALDPQGAVFALIALDRADGPPSL